MRRAILWLVGAAFGTALLVGVKAQGAVPAGIAAEAPVDSPVVAGDAPAATAGTTTTKPEPSASKAPAPAGKASPTPRRTTKPATTPKKTTAAPAPARRTITGTAVPASDFGSMQVSIVVTGTHIDSISTLQVSNRPKTVAATLTQQALAAQSANVGNVSGATYSSDAWKQSLQSAIGRI